MPYPFGAIPATREERMLFRAHLTANQSLANGATVPWNGEYDPQGWYNNTAAAVGGVSAYSFRPAVAGYWAFTWQGQISGLTANNYGALRLMKNGVGNNRTPRAMGWGTKPWRVHGSAIFYANGTTDEFRISVESSMTVTVGAGGGDAVTTYWMGWLVGA